MSEEIKTNNTLTDKELSQVNGGTSSEEWCPKGLPRSFFPFDGVIVDDCCKSCDRSLFGLDPYGDTLNSGARRHVLICNHFVLFGHVYC